MDVLFRFVKTMLLLDVFRLEKKQMLARAIQRTLEFGVRMNIQTTRYNRRPVQICEDQMEFSNCHHDLQIKQYIFIEKTQRLHQRYDSRNKGRKQK